MKWTNIHIIGVPGKKTERKAQKVIQINNDWKVWCIKSTEVKLEREEGTVNRIWPQMEKAQVERWDLFSEAYISVKEIQPVHPKGDQSWIFIGRTVAEGETPILWPPDAKNWLIWKDPDAGKDWRWEEKGKTEDEMVGWLHWQGGHEFE